MSSAYHPQSNKRAKVAVKQAKRLVTGSLGPWVEVDTDRLARALIEHRNTLDPETGLSPAQIVYGRQLRGFLPQADSKLAVKEELQLDAKRREANYTQTVSDAGDCSRGQNSLNPSRWARRWRFRIHPQVGKNEGGQSQAQ